MREQLVIGNWKMNGSLSLIEQFGHFFNKKNKGLAIAVPFLYITAAKTHLKQQVDIGAQDVSEIAEGSYTGNVSAAMLADTGCDFCIVGHSERRRHQGESDQMVAQKIEQLNRHAIRPVLCVGESKEERQNGVAETTVTAQLQACAQSLRQADAPIIAYEPLWAIGTGESASPEIARQMHCVIRAFLQDIARADVPILYGGSVNPGNAAELLSQDAIDGLLVGGASLKPQHLGSIFACIECS